MFIDLLANVLLSGISLIFSDELVDQVLGELNINMANQIPGQWRSMSEFRQKSICLDAQNGALGGRVAAPGQGQQAQAISTADADLEARLEALRRN